MPVLFIGHSCDGKIIEPSEWPLRTHDSLIMA